MCFLVEPAAYLYHKEQIWSTVIACVASLEYLYLISHAFAIWSSFLCDTVQIFLGTYLLAAWTLR